MLDAHIKNEAACTIAAIKVPIKEASRFGILNVKEDGEIYEFEEKPKVPKSDLASMGIYIFTAKKLYEYLEKDELNPNSKNDFGGNVLPDMLNCGEKMMSYEFDGYWKDVGTISSLFEANMDLLGDKPAFELDDKNWIIRSRNPIAPPHYIGKNGVVSNSLISSGCEIEGTVLNSVLSHNVEVEEGAIVKNSIIFRDVKIKKGAVIENSILDENVIVNENAKIGKENSDSKIAVLGRNYEVPAGETIDAGVIVDKN